MRIPKSKALTEKDHRIFDRLIPNLLIHIKYEYCQSLPDNLSIDQKRIMVESLKTACGIIGGMSADEFNV
jgi:hypothetical protein